MPPKLPEMWEVLIYIRRITNQKAAMLSAMLWRGACDQELNPFNNHVNELKIHLPPIKSSDKTAIQLTV